MRLLLIVNLPFVDILFPFVSSSFLRNSQLPKLVITNTNTITHSDVYNDT